MNGALTITAPKKAALELNAIFENATVGILFTHNRKLMQANRLCAEMFGYRLDEFLGHSALILYESAEAYSALGREAGPVLSRGESFKAETRLKRRDGSLFWCRVSAKAVDPEHPRDGTLWIIEDITEDRRIVEALENRTRELSAIFETASVGIGLVRNRAFVRSNRRFEEIFGLPPDAVALLQVVPYKGSLPTSVPTDPLIYRFYELISVYGTTFKELIHEEFGDGIMSAIDFKMDMKREPNPAGDRVNITMSGKFLPYKSY